MRIILIIICVILLIFYLVANIKVKESTLIKLCGSLTRDANITQQTIDEYCSMLNSLLDMNDVIILDVTDNFALLRAINRSMSMSTPENLKSNIEEIINKYS